MLRNFLNLIQVWILLLVVIEASPLGLVLPAVKPKDVDKGHQNCLRYNVRKSELVVIRINSGEKIKGQSLNMKIFDDHDNLYRSKENIQEKTRIAFTIGDEFHYFDICLHNVLTDLSWSKSGEDRHIILDVEVGDEARYENSLKQSEIYAPMMFELYKIERLDEVIERDLAGLVEKEIRLRDLNESTQERYLYSQFFIILSLIIFGICQVTYYRHYLRSINVL